MGNFDERQWGISVSAVTPTTRQSDRRTVVKERNSVACAIPKRATELSAPEGIRTPNLLIRRHRLSVVT